MKKLALCLTVGGYLIIASVGCSPMACATHDMLEIVGVDCQIVSLTIDDLEGFGHLVVQVDGELYEPRYLGMYKQDNINYTHPVWVYESRQDYNDVHDTFLTFNETLCFVLEVIK